MEMDETSRLFAMNLKRIREERKLTQEELARMIHTTRKSIGSYERGETFPYPAVISGIAKALNTEIAALFLREGDSLNINYTYADEVIDQALFEFGQNLKRKARESSIETREGTK